MNPKCMDNTEKISKLLRYHRKHVFDKNGELHSRAIRRLKKTNPFIKMCEKNRANAIQRLNEKLDRMGY